MSLIEILAVIGFIAPITAGIGQGMRAGVIGIIIGAVVGLSVGIATVFAIYKTLNYLDDRWPQKDEHSNPRSSTVEFILGAFAFSWTCMWAFGSGFIAFFVVKKIIDYIM